MRRRQESKIKPQEMLISNKIAEAEDLITAFEHKVGVSLQQSVFDVSEFDIKQIKARNNNHFERLTFLKEHIEQRLIDAQGAVDPQYQDLKKEYEKVDLDHTYIVDQELTPLLIDYLKSIQAPVRAGLFSSSAGSSSETPNTVVHKP